MDYTLPKPDFTKLSHTRSTLAENGNSSATITTSLVQPGNSNLQNKFKPIIAFDADILDDGNNFDCYVHPWGTGDSEFDEQMHLPHAGRNCASPDYSAALTSGQLPAPVGQDDRDTMPEPDTSVEAKDVGKFPHLPRPSVAPSNPASDNYGLTSSAEEEIVNLVDPVPETLPQRPPSSVIHEFAPMLDVYDFALQRSPTGQTVTLSKAARTEEDLMDYEMDWDEILKSVPSRPKGSSVLEKLDHFVASSTTPAITNTSATQVLQTTKALTATQVLEQTQGSHGSYNSHETQ